MHIYYWRYTLVPKKPLNALSTGQPRRGALIRAGDGFADVHPWVELGDLPLDEQLSRLARGELTALTRASLRLAEVDGVARARGVSLFEGHEIPRSHWPLAAGSILDGFEYVKVKAGPASDPRELKDLTGHRIRIDFNETLTEEQFRRWADSLSPEVREAIDFVEDPCAYDARTWSALREATGLRLALDRQTADEGVDVLVVKPAVQEMPLTDKETVITSYMDHPIGQFGAAFTAATGAGRIGVCGLMTHLLYEPDVFTERVKRHGDRLLPPGGTGIGFDDLLEELPWKRL